jgi:23S rRNA (uracil1939-C5)-methyltransferase
MPEVTIERLNQEGEGVARLEGRAITVPFTLPGERVRIEIDARGAGATAGRLVEVLQSSPHRVRPRCQHFGPRAPETRSDGPCGGCAWQHIAYAEQLRLKTALVDRLVRAAVPNAPHALPCLPGTDPADPWGYRHKVHFVFGQAPIAGRRKPALVMGHYRRGTRRVVGVRECPVHDERGNALAFRLRDAFVRAGVSAVDPDASRHRTPNATLRSLALRVGHGTPELLATLVVSSDRDRRLRDATRAALAAAPPTGLHLNLHPDGDAYVFGRDTRHLAGRERMREQVADTSFLLSPTAFFQTNVRAAGTLVSLVTAAVPPGARVLDLYAGVGLFALPLARRGHIVTAVEESRQAVADADASRRLNKLSEDACRLVGRRVETVLRTIERHDVVVIDPPRAGCTSAVLTAIFGRMRPARVVYVSCNPEALARDLRAIGRHRWKVASVQPVDMFPHTPHVETVVVLEAGARNRAT